MYEIDARCKERNKARSADCQDKIVRITGKTLKILSQAALNDLEKIIISLKKERSLVGQVR